MFCPACGHDNPTEAVFCGKCGTTLLQPAVPVPVPAAVEAVPPAPAEAIRYSGFWRRVGASATDALFLLMLFGLIALGAFLSGLTRASLGPMLMLWVLAVILMVIAMFAYDWLFVALNKGQTPGKKLLSIRVVDGAGDVPSLGRAAAREGARVAMGLVPYAGPIAYLVAHLWIIWDKKKQSLYDKIAGTYVIRSGE